MALTDRLTLTEKLMLVSVVMLLVAGCSLVVRAGGGSGGEGQVLYLADDGRTIELAMGQTLVLELDANPTTGYSWQVAESAAGILEQVGEPTFKRAATDAATVGAGGVQVYTFRAAESGEGLLELVYHRLWGEDVDPLNIFTVKVVVR